MNLTVQSYCESLPVVFLGGSLQSTLHLVASLGEWQSYKLGGGSMLNLSLKRTRYLTVLINVLKISVAGLTELLQFVISEMVWSGSKPSKIVILWSSSMKEDQKQTSINYRHVEKHFAVN